MTLLTCDCDCSESRPMGPQRDDIGVGVFGEFYSSDAGDSEGYAALRFRVRRSQAKAGLTKYWAVHFDGRHVLDVLPPVDGAITIVSDGPDAGTIEKIRRQFNASIQRLN